jgi:hypothetical protein
VLPYFAFREISRKLGPGGFHKLLFGSPIKDGV